MFHDSYRVQCFYQYIQTIINNQLMTAEVGIFKMQNHYIYKQIALTIEQYLIARQSTHIYIDGTTLCYQYTFNQHKNVQPNKHEDKKIANDRKFVFPIRMSLQLIQQKKTNNISHNYNMHNCRNSQNSINCQFSNQNHIRQLYDNHSDDLTTIIVAKSSLETQLICTLSQAQKHSLINKYNKTNINGCTFYINQQLKTLQAKSCLVNKQIQTNNLYTDYQGTTENKRLKDQVYSLLETIQNNFFQFYVKNNTIVSSDIGYAQVKSHSIGGSTINSKQLRNSQSAKDIVNIITKFKNLIAQEISNRVKNSYKCAEISRSEVIKIRINPQLSSQLKKETKTISEKWRQQYNAVKSKFYALSVRKPAIFAPSLKIVPTCPKLCKKKQQAITNVTNQNQNQGMSDEKQQQILMANIKMITILNKQVMDWQPENGHNYGLVTKIKAEYQINKLSLYRETNEVLNLTGNQKSQMQEIALVSDLNSNAVSSNYNTQFCTLSGFLIEKSRNDKVDKNSNSFKTQMLVLMKLRQFYCEYVAQYYFQEIVDILSKVDKFYLAWYPRDLKFIINNRLKAKSYLVISKHISQGLSFLSEKKILHRDLKPANIMLDEKYQPKIIDFGSASPFYSHKKKLLNSMDIDFRLLSTQGYYYSYRCFQNMNSGEQITQDEYEMHENFDIYSLGAILQHLFNRYEVKKDLGMQICSNLDWLIKKSKQPNPYDRPNSEQVNIFFQLLCKLWILQSKHKQ